MPREMKEFWNKYKKEHSLPNTIPRATHLRSTGFFDWWRLTDEEKRIRNHFDGYRAYKEHVESVEIKSVEMPISYDEFKRIMNSFYGWDFSTNGEKSIN